MTRRLQLLDDSIIATMKMWYKKCHPERAVDLADMIANNIYEIDSLKAMKWLCAVWGEIRSVTIQNCW